LPLVKQKTKSQSPFLLLHRESFLLHFKPPHYQRQSHW
jgi:hypothetical protein